MRLSEVYPVLSHSFLAEHKGIPREYKLNCNEQGGKVNQGWMHELAIIGARREGNAREICVSAGDILGDTWEENARGVYGKQRPDIRVTTQAEQGVLGIIKSWIIG